MKKWNMVLVLILILVFSFSNISYGVEDKTILILLDELDYQYIEEIFNNENFGIGFMNLGIKSPYEEESLFFSIATGRKLKANGEDYRGLYKNKDGIIKVAGYEDMFANVRKRNKNIKIDTLGDKLKAKGISYIGDTSSAIIAADKNGYIESGEVEVNYNETWLKDKTNYHLSNSNTLVLSYEIAQKKDRIKLLERYIHEFNNYNIIMFPKQVSMELEYIINKNLTPIIYLTNGEKGLVESSSTRREGFVTPEDISVELLSINGENSKLFIGNKINIVEEQDNIVESKNLFKKTVNLIWITYIFHGIVYFLQCYCAYYIYKNKKDRFHDIGIYNNFIVINIFISILMGASNLHINIVLYLFINLLTTYIITDFISEKEVNAIGLFGILTYGLLLLGMFFFPRIIYNSYIGFNNLFYGARYYGFNNGVMGVLLISSIISYFFIKDLMPNKFIDNLVALFFFSMNMVVLSANYGANTGGFITSVALFLIIIYINFLDNNRNIRNITILIIVGVLIFGLNMYFDSLSNEKSHAINFISRIKAFGFNEFLNMFSIKIKELIKLTILPPFSIVIIAQIFSLKILLKEKEGKINIEAKIILITAIIGFLLNDTGMITFIYMIHYLIALLIYEKIENPSKD